MNDDQMCADIASLQAELAFQGDTIDGLNEALASQQQDILMLQRQLSLLAEQLTALRNNGGKAEVAPDNEKPPHY